MKKLVSALAILTVASCFTLLACGDDDDTAPVNAGGNPSGGTSTTGGTKTAGTAGQGGG